MYRHDGQLRIIGGSSCILLFIFLPTPHHLLTPSQNEFRRAGYTRSELDSTITIFFCLIVFFFHYYSVWNIAICNQTKPRVHQVCNVRTWRTRVHMCMSPAVSACRRKERKKMFKKLYAQLLRQFFLIYIIIISLAHVAHSWCTAWFSSANSNDTIHLSGRRTSHAQRMSYDQDDVSFYILILFSLSYRARTFSL